MDLLVVDGRFEFRIDRLHARHQRVPVLLQLAAGPKLARVQPLAVAAVNRFGRWRSAHTIRKRISDSGRSTTVVTLWSDAFSILATQRANSGAGRFISHRVKDVLCCACAAFVCAKCTFDNESYGEKLIRLEQKFFIIINSLLWLDFESETDRS